MLQKKIFLPFVLQIDCIDFIHYSSPNPLQPWQAHCSLFTKPIIGSVSDAAEYYACHFRTHQILPFIRVSQLHLSAPARGRENLLEYKSGLMGLWSTSAKHEQSPREHFPGDNDARPSPRLWSVRGWNALIRALGADRHAGLLARPAASLGVTISC